MKNSMLIPVAALALLLSGAALAKEAARPAATKPAAIAKSPAHIAGTEASRSDKTGGGASNNLSGANTYSGAKTYTGATTVSAGTLNVVGSDSAAGKPGEKVGGRKADIAIDKSSRPAGAGKPSRAGDGNGDGLVNATDLAVWKSNTLISGDYNNNGVVDAADYAIWRKNQSKPPQAAPGR